jgi:large subunit ribosomal protein L21
MYAVIEAGGKQLRVTEGSTFRTEKIVGRLGGKVSFDRVLLVERDGEIAVGAPIVEGAKVVGKIVAQGKTRKVYGYKYKRRKRYRKKLGHRQEFTQVTVKSIEAPAKA